MPTIANVAPVKIETGRYCKLTPCADCGVLVGRGRKRCEPCAADAKVNRTRDARGVRHAMWCGHPEDEGAMAHTPPCGNRHLWGVRIADEDNPVNCESCLAYMAKFFRTGRSGMPPYDITAMTVALQRKWRDAPDYDECGGMMDGIKHERRVYDLNQWLAQPPPRE